MAGIFDVNAQELVEKTAEELKKVPEIQPPAWSAFVKTGMHKERQPIKDDWWYSRSAAVLRSVAKLGPIGTQKLRTKFGGKKNRGHKPEHGYKSSGAIIRKVLQQLETAGLIAKAGKGIHKGRVLAQKGQSLLMHVAKGLGAGTVVRKKTEAKPAKKKSEKKDGKSGGAAKKETASPAEPTGPAS